MRSKVIRWKNFWELLRVTQSTIASTPKQFISLRSLMCEQLNHEAYNRKQNLIKGAHGVRANSLRLRSVLIYGMDYSKITLFSSVLLLLTIVQAQEYYFEKYGSEPSARARRDVAEFVLSAEPRENFRFRRDDENARHRRQGGHGGGNGGGHEGITGPVHTFVKTDEHAHFKWGVRHHVGHEYAGRR